MRDYTFKCNCGEILVKSQTSGDYRIRGKITLLKGGKIYSVCKGCNKEVELPMEAQVKTRDPKVFIRL